MYDFLIIIVTNVITGLIVKGILISINELYKKYKKILHSKYITIIRVSIEALFFIPTKQTNRGGEAWQGHLMKEQKKLSSCTNRGLN